MSKHTKDIETPSSLDDRSSGVYEDLSSSCDAAVAVTARFDDIDPLITLSADAEGNVFELFASGRRRVSLNFEHDAGLTEQSHKDSCDITYILSQHIRMGGVPPMPETQFVDLTKSISYQECLDKVLQIDDLFASLPLEARVAYDHDAAKFMAAVDDPNQRARMIELGIFEPVKTGSNSEQPKAGSSSDHPKDGSVIGST